MLRIGRFLGGCLILSTFENSGYLPKLNLCFFRTVVTHPNNHSTLVFDLILFGITFCAQQIPLLSRKIEALARGSVVVASCVQLRKNVCLMLGYPFPFVRDLFSHTAREVNSQPG